MFRCGLQIVCSLLNNYFLQSIKYHICISQGNQRFSRKLFSNFSWFLSCLVRGFFFFNTIVQFLFWQPQFFKNFVLFKKFPELNQNSMTFPRFPNVPEGDNPASVARKRGMHFIIQISLKCKGKVTNFLIQLLLQRNRFSPRNLQNFP